MKQYTQINWKKKTYILCVSRHNGGPIHGPFKQGLYYDKAAMVRGVPGVSLQ